MLRTAAVSNIAQRLLTAVFPPSCPVCRDETGAPMALCPVCWRDLAFLGDNGCTTCGHPVPGVAGSEILQCDDCLHHPSQIIFPEWNSGFCENPAQSAATRRSVLERLADTDTQMIPAHFVDPGRGHIVSAGERFGFKPIVD